MSPSIREQELEEEVSFLKRQLGIEADKDIARKLTEALGVTRYQARLLTVMYVRRGAILTKDALLDAMYAGQADEPFVKIVDVFVSQIRRQIGGGAIRTLWGQGYGLSPEGLDLCSRALAGEVRLQRRRAA